MSTIISYLVVEINPKNTNLCLEHIQQNNPEFYSENTNKIDVLGHILDCDLGVNRTLKIE